MSHAASDALRIREAVRALLIDPDDRVLLVRFEFPERPGALLNFLTGLGRRWNISLFHYRNHGAAYGRVLMGLQVPVDERPDCIQRLDQLGYRYWDETTNPACRIFTGTTVD